MRLRYSLFTKRDTVPAAKVEKAPAIIDRALGISSYELRQGCRPPRIDGVVRGLFYVSSSRAGTLVLYGWMRRRRSARLAGLTPSRRLPARCRDGHQAGRRGRIALVERFEARLRPPRLRRRLAPGSVYDGPALVVVHVRCDGCRATRDFYFTSRPRRRRVGGGMKVDVPEDA